MFGLMLLGIVVVWVLVTIPIARWLGKKLPDKPWRKAAQIALFPLVFAVPVLDEIIAWPQLRALCDGAGIYSYPPGMTQEKAMGRAVYNTYRNDLEFLFPLVSVRRIRDELVDLGTGETILTSHAVEPESSMLALPTASGTRATWILRRCPPPTSTWEKNRLLTDEVLKLKKVEPPKTRR